MYVIRCVWCDEAKQYLTMGVFPEQPEDTHKVDWIWTFKRAEAVHFASREQAFQIARGLRKYVVEYCDVAVIKVST